MTGRLRLNRLSVHRNKEILYDELFHDGVNIIYGDNGSGKSTIADFIYYALGGDLREWRQEAALAHYVLAEITAGDAVLTLRRDISDSGARPMQIYFGAYNAAVAADVRTWESFPYKRPESGYSFSQVMFRAIGIPEAISDGLSNITMHQLLRILYSDQLTPIQRYFESKLSILGKQGKLSATYSVASAATIFTPYSFFSERWKRNSMTFRPS